MLSPTSGSVSPARLSSALPESITVVVDVEVAEEALAVVVVEEETVIAIVRMEIAAVAAEVVRVQVDVVVEVEVVPSRLTTPETSPHLGRRCGGKKGDVEEGRKEEE
jgi:hypothetical protein